MKKHLVPLLLVLALLLGMAAALVVSARQAAALEKQMQGVWYREGGEDWHLALVVTEGKMEYRFVSSQFPDMTETLYTYGLKAKNGNTIRVEFPEADADAAVSVTVTEKEMTFSPAITSAEESEVWKKR